MINPYWNYAYEMAIERATELRDWVGVEVLFNAYGNWMEQNDKTPQN